MKARKILHVVFDSFAALLGLLFLLSYVVPFLQSGSTSYYLLTFGAVSISSSSIGGNFFYSILIAILTILGLFFLVMKDSNLLHDIGIAFSLGDAFYAFALHHEVKALLSSSSSSSSTNVQHPGEVIYFIYAILVLVLALAVLLDDLFGEQLFARLESSKRPSKESRLIELKSMLDKQLITSEEFEAKRKEILDEK